MASFCLHIRKKKKIRIVGNAKGLDFTDPDTQKRAEALVEAVVKMDPSEIWWDGDAYNDSSFTKIIKDLVTEVRITATFHSVCVSEKYAPKLAPFEPRLNMNESVPIEEFVETHKLEGFDARLLNDGIEKNGNELEVDHLGYEALVSGIDLTIQERKAKWKGKYVRLALLSTNGNKIETVFCFGGGGNVIAEKIKAKTLKLNVDYINF